MFVVSRDNIDLYVKNNDKRNDERLIVALTYDSRNCSIEARQKIADDRVFAWNLSAACFNAGVGTITKKNFDEFWERYCVFQLSIGGFLYITRDDAERCVGFSTNVETLSKTKFAKGIMDNMFRNAPKLVRPAPFVTND